MEGRGWHRLSNECHIPSTTRDRNERGHPAVSDHEPDPVGRLGAILPSAAEARSILRAILASDYSVTRTTPTDPDLVALLEAEFTTADTVLTRLRAAETRLREQGDRRSVFLTVYTRMTEQVLAGVDDGAFRDPDWVSDYLVSFGNAYRRAHLAYERGDYSDVPVPWRIAFDTARSEDTLALQDALLGVNAHINYDLAYTLEEAGIDPDRPDRHADHDHVNAILADLVDTVQEALVTVYDALGVTSADTLLGHLDEQLMLLGLTGGRAFAWENAVLLADGPRWLTSPLVEWRLRTTSTGIAHVLRSTRLDPQVRDRLRDVEVDATALAAFADEFDDHLATDTPQTTDEQPTSRP